MGRQKIAAETMSAAGARTSHAKVLPALVLLCVAGCKSKPASVDDAALTTTIQNQLTADASINGQPVQVAVAGGVATLSGSVQNDAQRTIAARDAAGVAGVKEVVDNITVSAFPPASASVNATSPTQLSAPSRRTDAKVRSQFQQSPQSFGQTHEPAPVERVPPPQQQAYVPPPVQQAPPPPPAPTFKTVTVASGESIAVRVTQTLDSASTQPGASFSGVVSSDVLVDGLVAIPAGSAVSGHVDDVKDAAHFKGSASLTLSLASITRRGEHIPVTTDPYTVQGKGRGSNTAEKVGGGAAVGAILGGIFGGGKGAAIGAAAGGGTGAGVNAVTRGQQVQVASETVVRFTLQTPVTVRVRIDGGDRRERGDQPALQPGTDHP